MVHAEEDVPSLPLLVRYQGKPGLAEPSSNLYVKGIPLGTSEDAVRSAFSQFGVVQRMRVMPPVGEQSDQTALVEMGDLAQAAAAIAGLNGGVMGGGAAVGEQKVLTARFA